MQSTFAVLKGNCGIKLTFHHTALYHLVHKLHHQHPCGLQIPRKKRGTKKVFSLVIYSNARKHVLFINFTFLQQVSARTLNKEVDS